VSTYSSIPPRKATPFQLCARPAHCCAPVTRRLSFPAKQTARCFVAHVQRVAFLLTCPLRLSPCLTLWLNSRYICFNFPHEQQARAACHTMASDTAVQSRHAWSLMNENDLTQRLQRLRLILNRPEPVLICQQCKYALQPSGTRVSKHLAEKRAIPASERKELVSYIDSLHLSNPNLLDRRRNGSEPHPHLLVSRGAACKYCSFHSKSSRLV
jgi:hypothetical protein